MYASTRLNEHHQLSSFDSGRPELDNWLKDHALRSDRKHQTATYVWVDGGAVVAYYSLCVHQLRRETLPPKVARGNLSIIPAMLLARLALDKTIQGQGHGAALLVDALEVAVQVADAGGARYVVVHALDETAADFYEHFDFLPCPSIEGQQITLIRKVSDLEKALG